MQALLLDLDGTMVHSDPVHAAVFVDLLAQFGQTIDEAFYLSHIHGRQNIDIFGDLLPGENAQALSLRKEAMYRDRLDHVEPIAGLGAFIAAARAGGFAIGLVTNEPRLNADAVLAALGMTDAFDTIVIGDECARGKPDPLPYVTALANLGANATRSLAVEDSPSGIRAAAGAGLLTFAMRSSLPAAALVAAGAHHTIADFDDSALHTALSRLTGAAP